MSYEMIIYISKATRPLSSEETEQLAVLAAKRNQNAEITGMLLQIGDYFVQVLEGKSQGLSSLLKKIENDDRHGELRVIYKTSSQSRTFAQWNMGYFNIEQYYQVNRQDVTQLRHYVQKAFATSKTAKEAIVQIIQSIPVLMQDWEIKKLDELAVSVR